MKTVSLQVNGKAHRIDVEPRTSLADLLRTELLLTGTHLGCEQGVCGACTVEIDGAPARSCIAYAVACDGAKIRTIEGFDDDPLMADLRQAFSSEHALQCGYCTPGMLITARDICRRLPGSDENRIRTELSGNLCRCTGYVGIVRAVRLVANRQAKNVQGAGRTEYPSVPNRRRQTAVHRPAPSVCKPSERPPEAAQPAPPGGMTRLDQEFMVPYPPDLVWAMLKDLPLIVDCMPGASLIVPPEDGHIRGRITTKLGPIRADFSGEADVALDDENRSGIIRGTGLDTGHGSRARGEVRYHLFAAAGSVTRVSVIVSFSLTGTLAQFSRGGIVRAVANQLTQTFAANLEAALATPAGESARRKTKAAEMNLVSLILAALRARGRAVIAAVYRKD